MLEGRDQHAGGEPWQSHTCERLLHASPRHDFAAKHSKETLKIRDIIGATQM